MSKKVTASQTDPRLLAFIAPGMVPRTPRRVVTRSGKRVRGNYPSVKATEARFESLVEQRTWAVFEVANMVEAFATHPASLRIEVDAGDEAFRYTPDFSVVPCWRETAVGEVKPDRKFVKPEVYERLLKVWRAFEEDGTQFFVVLESDLLYIPGLQEDLDILLRNRPWRRNWIFCEGSKTVGVEDQLFDRDAWARSSKACDDLLQRVMARDFKQTLEQARSSVCV